MTGKGEREGKEKESGGVGPAAGVGGLLQGLKGDRRPWSIVHLGQRLQQSEAAMQGYKTRFTHF